MNILIFFIIVLTVWIAVAWLIKKGRDEYSIESKKISEINSMPIDEAKNRALSLLQDKSCFKCTRSELSVEKSLNVFPDGLKELFAYYESIESVRGPQVQLDRNSVRKSVNQLGYMVIGIGMEGSDTEYEICVNPPDETIYECYRNEKIDLSFGAYSSIYHWIICTAEESK